MQRSLDAICGLCKVQNIDVSNVQQCDLCGIGVAFKAQPYQIHVVGFCIHWVVCNVWSFDQVSECLKLVGAGLTASVFTIIHDLMNAVSIEGST